MSPSAITAIVLAFFLGIAAMVAVIHYRNAVGLRARNSRLRLEIDNRKAAQADHNATYVAIRITPDSSIDPKVWCEWAVVRQSILDGHMYNTLIKAFTDEDDDFNKRQAEELAEILNQQ